MLGVKVAAITLTSLGSVTMGSDVYLATHARSAVHESWQPSRVGISGPPLDVQAAPGSQTTTPATNSVVMEPIVIHSRSPAQ